MWPDASSPCRWRRRIRAPIWRTKWMKSSASQRRRISGQWANSTTTSRRPVTRKCAICWPMLRGSEIRDMENQIEIPVRGATLSGILTTPRVPRGIVLFAHGSGSSRHSPRNRLVATTLNRARLGTLLLDLLTPEEESVDESTRELRFNIALLAERLGFATEWIAQDPRTRDVPVGLFGSSTGGAAALVAAAERPARIAAIVSRGGRPDLAGTALANVRAPTLLIVGS